MASSANATDRLLSLARVDLRPNHEGPALWRVALATVLAIGLSLAADAAIVVIATHVYPSTKGYSHFRFEDYAKLTIVGIIIGCAAWPIVARVTSAPRWVFFRCAILVSAVLLLPDVWIWHHGQPIRAVAFLMCMHIAIALITYNLLIHLAPVRARARHAAA